MPQKSSFLLYNKDFCNLNLRLLSKWVVVECHFRMNTPPPGPNREPTQQGLNLSPNQVVVTTQPNTGGAKQGIAGVVLAEIEEGGMLSSALEVMEYDVMQWAKEKRKRAVLDDYDADAVETGDYKGFSTDIN